MLDEEDLQEFKSLCYVPEDADVPLFDGLTPLTQLFVRWAYYKYNCRRQAFLDGIGTETIATLDGMPRPTAEKALRGSYHNHVGNWKFDFWLCIFIGAWLEGLLKLLYKSAAELAGLPSDTPEIKRVKDKDDIVSAVFETINICVDESRQLLDPRTLKPRLSDDEYCRRLAFLDIHIHDFRRNLRNLLRARRRRQEPDQEISIAPELDPSGPHPLEPDLYGQPRPRRPEGASSNEEGSRRLEPDRTIELDRTRRGEEQDVARAMGLIEENALPQEELKSFYTEEDLDRLARKARLPPHPYRNFYREKKLCNLAGFRFRAHPCVNLYTRKHLRSLAETEKDLPAYLNLYAKAPFFTKEELRSLPEVEWSLLWLHPVTNFYTFMVDDPEAEAGWPRVRFYTREITYLGLNVAWPRVSVRTKNLLDASLESHCAGDLLKAVIAEEKKADRGESDIEKIKRARYDAIHGELVVVKIGGPQRKIAGEKDAPPLTVDTTCDHPVIPELAIAGDVPDSIHRTHETGESDLIGERESQAREKRGWEAIEILCQARNAQDREMRCRVVEYAVANDVGFRTAASALGYPVRVADEITRRAWRFRKREREAPKRTPSKSPSNPAT
jgi:hypothetical protein